MWNRRRILAWLILIPLAVLAAIALSIPLFVNSADYKDLLVEQAERHLGRKVEIAKASIEVFPRVRIALDDVTIKELDGHDTFLFTDHLFLELRVFPLLARKVVVKSIILDRPKMVIRRGASGILNLSDLFPPTTNPTDIATPMLGEEISISDGEFAFEDEYETDRRRVVMLRHVTMTLRRAGTLLGFKFFATLPYENAEATFNLSGQVSREALTGQRPGGKAVGRVEAKGMHPSQIAVFLHENPILQALRIPVNLSSGFEYRWAKGERTLSLNQMTVTGGGTTITGGVTLEKLFSPQMKVAASLSATPFRIESLYERLPEDILKAYSLEFLKDGKAASLLQIASLTLRWDPEQERRLTAQGEVNVTGGSAVVGDHHVPLSEVKGKLLVSQDRIAIEQVTGKYGQAQVTEGRGEVGPLIGDPRLFLDIKGRVQAPELAVIVARFAPKPLLPSGPAGLSKLQGEADASVQLAGHLTKLHDLDVRWSIDAKDVGFTDRRLNLPFAGLKGRVRSIPRGVAFDHLNGRIGQSAVALGGEIAIHSDEKAHYALMISGQADVPEALGLVPGRPKDLVGSGTAPFGLSVSGRTGEFRGIGRMDFRNAELAHAGGYKKPGGAASTVEFDVLLEPGRQLKVDRLAAEILPFKILTKGTVTFQPSPGRFDLTFRIPAFSFRALPKGTLPAKAMPDAGSLHAHFSASGPLDNWRGARLKGNAEIKQVGFKIEGIAAPIEDLNATLSFEDDRIEVQQGTVKIADSRINASGDVRGWRGMPRIQATFDSPDLELELLIPKGERSPVRAAVETLTRDAKFTATANVRNGRYHGVPFDELHAKVAGGDGVLVLDPVGGKMGAGTVAGQGRIALPAGRGASVESSLHLKGIAVEPVFRSFGITDPPFTGTMSLDGAIRGDGNDPRGTAPTLNGDLNIRIANGFSQRLSATAKVVRLLDLPRVLIGKAQVSEKGMPFDCMSGQVTIRNGIAEIKDYRMDSQIMKITAAGTYDIPNDKYDMVMVVTPFGSSETLLQSIPLFGKLFAGEREGFSTAFFEVRGPIADPVVTWVPMKSVGSGLTGLFQLAFDLMKNTILLPKELIKPSLKAQSPCSAQ